MSNPNDQVKILATGMLEQSGNPDANLQTPETRDDSLGFSFEPIELDENSAGPIGPGRPANPLVKIFGDRSLEVFTNLRPNSRYENPETGKPWGLPIPDSITNRPIQHRDGTQNIDKLANSRNFATQIKQYCQRALNENLRDCIQIGVVPMKTPRGLVYTLAIRRFARIG